MNDKSEDFDDECPDCEGTGMLDHTCETCAGVGWVDDPKGGTMSCPECGGDDCPSCSGTGQTF